LLLSFEWEHVKIVYHCVCFCIAANDQLVWHAIVLLEKAVSNSLSNFQFKLLLIQLYSKLGELP